MYVCVHITKYRIIFKHRLLQSVSRTTLKHSSLFFYKRYISFSARLVAKIKPRVRQPNVFFLHDFLKGDLIQI